MLVGWPMYSIRLGRERVGVVEKDQSSFHFLLFFKKKKNKNKKKPRVENSVS